MTSRQLSREQINHQLERATEALCQTIYRELRLAVARYGPVIRRELQAWAIRNQDALRALYWILPWQDRWTYTTMPFST